MPTPAPPRSPETLPPIKAAPAGILSIDLCGGQPFPYDMAQDRIYPSSGPAAATDYTKIQILKAAFGLGAAVPTPYYMGISLTPLYDSGLGLTEYSGNNYSRPAVAGWNSSALTGYAQPSADVVFPVPSAQWWPASEGAGTPGRFTQLWPFLADAPTGGNILWYWNTTTFTVDPAHPIGFRPFLSLASNVGTDAGGSAWLGGQTFGAGAPPTPPMFQGILDTLTGLTTYAPPPLYAGLGTSPSGSIDPPYPVVPLGGVTTPSIGSDGHAFCANANPLFWTAQAFGAGGSGNVDGIFPTTLFIGDGVGGGVGLPYFVTVMRALWATAGQTVQIPAGGVVFKVE